jgi:hypothetical protein
VNIEVSIYNAREQQSQSWPSLSGRETNRALPRKRADIGRLIGCTRDRQPRPSARGRSYSSTPEEEGRGKMVDACGTSVSNENGRDTGRVAHHLCGCHEAGSPPSLAWDEDFSILTPFSIGGANMPSF